MPTRQRLCLGRLLFCVKQQKHNLLRTPLPAHVARVCLVGNTLCMYLSIYPSKTNETRRGTQVWPIQPCLVSGTRLPQRICPTKPALPMLWRRLLNGHPLPKDICQGANNSSSEPFLNARRKKGPFKRFEEVSLPVTMLRRQHVVAWITMSEETRVRR